MRPTFILSAACAATLTASSFGQCGTGGSCFETHGTPGCDDVACCELVCAVDPFCCNNQWDSICVGEAESMCGCGAPESGSCLSEHSTPWCNDENCCEAVCDLDPFCCTVEWDGICVGEAESTCASCGGDGTHGCFTTGLPACSDEACCDTVCDADPFCCSVAWDGLCVSEAESLCGCGAPESGSCLDPDGTPWCDDGACCDAVCEIDLYCCTVAWDNLCVGEAESLCSVCGSDAAGSCFEEGLPACDHLECCEAVCNVDPFCCSVLWDGLCVDEAFDLCEGMCGVEIAGSCFVTGGPACSDEECCDLVCAADPFCCSVSWDGLCVDEAYAFCTPCGDTDAGSCFVPHSGLGCSAADCCSDVCQQDSFCCFVQWDGICAGEAESICTFTCLGDFDGSGDVGATDLSILLGGWGTFAGDLTGDGTTNAMDLGILLGAWGPCQGLK